MKKLGILTLAAVMGLALIPATASAAPITGDISFGGTFNPLPGPGLDTSTTGLDFTNPAVVTGGTGTYASVPFATLVTFTDFTFDPFAGPITLWTFSVGTTNYSFTLENITSITRDVNLLGLFGDGTLHVDGLDDTPGTWSFSADHTSGGALFAFSATNTVIGGEGEGAVPEPASLLLLGLGMTGVASRLARRRRA